jgi:hypothetical protein
MRPAQTGPPSRLRPRLCAGRPPHGHRDRRLPPAVAGRLEWPHPRGRRRQWAQLSSLSGHRHRGPGHRARTLPAPPGPGRGPTGAGADPGGGRHRRGPARPRRHRRRGGRQPGALLGRRPGPGAGGGPPGAALWGEVALLRARAATDARLVRWQGRLDRPWGWLVGGCLPNRDTVAAITAAGLQVVQLDRFDLQAMPPLARPHVLEEAERRP